MTPDSAASAGLRDAAPAARRLSAVPTPVAAAWHAADPLASSNDKDARVRAANVLKKYLLKDGK